MTPLLQHEEFVRHLNTEFRIRVGDAETIPAKLTNVSEQLIGPRQERFSVVYRTSNEPFLGQGMRPFEHDQMGNFDLFIVPLERNDEGTYYEAVFNRMIKK